MEKTPQQEVEVQWMAPLDGDDMKPRIYANDPLYLKTFVDKLVKVHMRDGSTVEGVVHSVDPVSESLILVREDESGGYELELLFGPSIDSLTVKGESDLVAKAPRPPAPKMEGLEERKAAVKDLMERNRLPLIEDQDGLLRFSYIFNILPPYRPQDCYSCNEVVLERVQRLLQSIPLGKSNNSPNS